MDNRCPHQSGPLGEGSIERGVDGQCWIRCPWHGWDFDPLTGAPPGGHGDTGQTLYPVELRDDDVFVGLEPEPEAPRTTSDVMAETIVAWGMKRVSRRGSPLLCRGDRRPVADLTQCAQNRDAA